MKNTKKLIVALGIAFALLLVTDIITYPIDVDPDLQVTKIQLLDAILKEMSSGGFDDGDFWNEMTNLQKAKIIR